MTDNGENEVVAKMAQKAFALSSNYENVRANYSLEAVEFFLRKLGTSWDNHDTASLNQTDRPFTILEVGCGTGKFTRVMLEVLKGKNVRVIASEPLQSMCEQLKLMVPDTEIIQCPAENIRKLNCLKPRGGSWVFFGWVCAARDSKLPPRSKKNLP